MNRRGFCKNVIGLLAAAVIMPKDGNVVTEGQIYQDLHYIKVLVRGETKARYYPVYGDWSQE